MLIRTLKNELRLWIVLLVLVPSLMTMAILTVNEIKEAKRGKLVLASQWVQAQQRLIDYWLVERADYIRRLSQLEEFRTLNLPKIETTLELAQQGERYFDFLSFIDKDGFFRATTIPQGISFPSAEGRTYFEEARAGKEYITAVVTGRNSGERVMGFSAPVYDPAGNFQGLILGAIKTTTLETLLDQYSIANSAEMFLVDRKGVMLTEPRQSKELGIGAETISDAAFRQIRLGEAGTAQWTDYLGHRVLGSYVDVPARNWTLIGKIDETEIFAPIYARLVMIAGDMVLMLLLLIPLATLLTNRIKRPIDWLIRQSNLVAREEYAAAGQEERPPNMPHELEVLCATFLEMSRKIESAIVLRKTHESDLQQKVREVGNINIMLGAQIRERQAAESAMERKLALEKILAGISRELISSPIDDGGEVIDRILGIVGRFAGCDLSFIFQENPEGTEATITHCWASTDNRKLVGIPQFYTADFAFERKYIETKEYIIASARDLPAEALSSKGFMEKFHLSSVVIISMVYAGKTYGVLGLGCHHACPWEQDLIAWLKIVTELIMHRLENRRTHAALRLQEEGNRALLNAVPDFFAEIDRQGVHQAAWGALSGYQGTEQDFVGKSIFEILPSELAQRFFEHIRSVIKDKQMQTLDYEVTLNGEQYMREARIVSYKQDQALLVIRDITEKKRAEQKILAAGMLVEQGERLASMGIMATSIAHEINQPLNSIIVSASGVVYALQNGVRLSREDFLTECSAITEQAERIAEIIGNIRMFVKNDYSLRQPVDVSEVISRAVKVCANQLLFGDISLHIGIAGDLPPVMANDMHLQQSVINLLSNAAHALAWAEKEKMIEISVWCEEKNVIVEVSDNGSGLEKGQEEKIFKPFYTNKTDVRAMGLGLAIVHTIVGSYGGKITAYNNAAGGATFRIELPAASE